MKWHRCMGRRTYELEYGCTNVDTSDVNIRSRVLNRFEELILNFPLKYVESWHVYYFQKKTPWNSVPIKIGISSTERGGGRRKRGKMLFVLLIIRLLCKLGDLTNYVSGVNRKSEDGNAINAFRPVISAFSARDCYRGLQYT